MTTTATIEPLDVWLIGQVQRVLDLPEPPAPDVSPVALGLTSLAAVTLQYRLMSDRGVSLTLEALMGGGSLAELASLAQTGGEA